MSETTINGCKIGSYSRMAKKCRQCSNKEYCNNKRMEAEAYIIPQETTITMQIPQVGISVQEASEALIKAMQNVNKCSSCRS